jgi:LysM repeat protein
MKLNLKFPNIFPARSKKRKLRATAARKPMRAATTADYDEMSEPNMKLSRALLIVLLLHVVAVSGIIAFNAIKTRQPASPPSVSTGENKSHSTPPKDAAPAESKVTHVTPKAVPEKEIRKAKPVTASESGKTYVVAKGDTPANIAKKFKVSYDELLEVNHIDDPHKLQIGHKLIIPAKAPKAKKVANE